MAFQVSLTRRAERDLEEIYLFIGADDSPAARRWYTDLKDALLSLREHPERCAKAPENPRLRHLLYGRKPHVYRVIYQVAAKGRRVNVLHVRHGARRIATDLTE
jgi:plasmid stabilization system protein ParE